MNERFAGLVICHVSETKDEETTGIEGARWFLHNIAKLFEPLMVKNQLYSYEYLRALFDLGADANDLSDAEIKAHPMVIAGNPDEVNRKLEKFNTSGLDQIIFFKQAGRIPHQNIMRSIRRIGESVIPYFNPSKAVVTEVDPQWAEEKVAVGQ